MDHGRKERIALLYLKNKIYQEGILINSNFRRQVVEAAFAFDASLEEVIKFKESDDFRNGKIAFHYLKNKIREEGVLINSDLDQRINDTVKSIGISFEEAMEFIEDLVREDFPDPH